MALTWPSRSAPSGDRIHESGQGDHPPTQRWWRPFTVWPRETPDGWSTPRIHGELRMLGFHVSQTTVSRLLPKGPSSKARRQSWRIFFRNHREHLADMDFLRRRLRPSARSMGLQSGRERNLPHGIHPLMEPSPHPAASLVKRHALRVATHDCSNVDGGLACADSPSAISRSASSYASIAEIRA